MNSSRAKHAFSCMIALMAIATSLCCFSLRNARYLSTVEMTKLYEALSFDDINVVQSFLRLGVSPDLELSISGDSDVYARKGMLYIAVASRSVRSVKLLLEAGACKYVRSSDGIMPIELVAFSSSSESIQIAQMLSEMPGDLGEGALMMHLSILTLGKCFGYIPMEVYAPPRVVVLYVNGEPVYVDSVQRGLKANGIPILLASKGSLEGRRVEIIFTPEGDHKYAVNVMVPGWDEYTMVRKWRGIVELRYGYRLYSSFEGVDI